MHACVWNNGKQTCSRAFSTKWCGGLSDGRRRLVWARKSHHYHLSSLNQHRDSVTALSLQATATTQCTHHSFYLSLLLPDSYYYYYYHFILGIIIIIIMGVFSNYRGSNILHIFYIVWEKMCLWYLNLSIRILLISCVKQVRGGNIFTFLPRSPRVVSDVTCSRPSPRPTFILRTDSWRVLRRDVTK